MRLLQYKFFASFFLSASVRLLSVFDLFVISCVANDYLSVGSDTLFADRQATAQQAVFSGSADGGDGGTATAAIAPATALLLYWHLCLRTGTQSHNHSVGSVQSVMPLYWTSHQHLGECSTRSLIGSSNAPTEHRRPLSASSTD